jgi:hypothetical protein
MTWIEERVGSLTAVVRRDRRRHYTVRVYRGNALSAIFSSLGSYNAWKAAQ